MNEMGNRLIERFYNWLTIYGVKLLIALLVVLAGQWAIRVLMRWTKKVLAKRRLNETLKPFILNLLNITLQVVLIMGVMQLLGIKMTLFAAFIGALGVAAGLALSGTLQNFTSGVMIILLRPFRIGDNIRTQGEEGTVTAIRLFYTSIVTYNNTSLIVPNGKLSNEVIFNLTLNTQRRYDVVLKLKKEQDFNQVKSILYEAVHSCAAVLKDPSPRIGIGEIAMNDYSISINVWLKAHGYEDGKLQLNEVLYEHIKKITSTAS